MKNRREHQKKKTGKLFRMLFSPKLWRKITSLALAFTVFLTTYMMILPALTIDLDTAVEEPGLDVAAAGDADGNLLAEDEGLQPENVGEIESGIADEFPESYDGESEDDAVLYDGEDINGPVDLAGIMNTSDDEYYGEYADSADIGDPYDKTEEPQVSAGVFSEESTEHVPVEEIIADDSDSEWAAEEADNYFEEEIPEIEPEEEDVFAEDTTDSQIPPEEFVETSEEETDEFLEDDDEALFIEEQEEMEDVTEPATNFTEETGEEASEEDIEGESAPCYVLKAAGEDYHVTVSFTEEAEIPEGAVLQVKEILPEDMDYEKYVNDAAETLSTEERIMSVNNARFFDITILDGKVSVEPKAPVTVLVELADEFAAEPDTAVLHYTDLETKVVNMIDPAEAAAYIEEAKNAEAAAAEEAESVAAGIAGEAALTDGIPESVPAVEEMQFEEFETGADIQEEGLIAEDSPILPEEEATVSDNALMLPEIENSISEEMCMFPEEEGVTSENAYVTPEEIPVVGAVLEEEPEGFALDETMNPIAFVTDSFSVYGFVTATLEKTILASDGHNYKVTVSFGPLTEIPEGAELLVEEIKEGTSSDGVGYEEYAARTENALRLQDKSSEYLRLFDISIVDRDGLKIQPASGSTVDVSIELADGTSEEVSVVHFADENDSGSFVDAEVDGQTVSFETDGFSVYAVAYTVDFHYEVNGKVYEFSIPGGGFVSLEHLVEVLGIATADENMEDGSNNPDTVIENVDEFAGDAQGADENVENGSATSEAAFENVNDFAEEAISINNVEVSEATGKFVADVAGVEFSNPEFVWVGKVETDSSIGALKEVNVPDIQYSAELTEEQIAEINRSTVNAGDWALISVKPFTSEETLTVTMRNGERFEVRVTDAQISTHVMTADGEDFIITVTYGPEAEIPVGSRLEARELLPGTEEYEEHFLLALDKIHEDDKHYTDGVLQTNDETVSALLEFGLEPVTFEYESGISFARFFDISIISEGWEIEPKAPVSVSISYAEPVKVENGLEAGVIHFADDGIEFPEVVTDPEESGEGEIKIFEFMQSSFSVSGTMLKYTGAVAPGKYILFVNSNGTFYALNANGGRTQITRNQDKVTFNDVPDNCQWTITKVDDNGTYTLKNGNSSLVLYNGAVVGSWTQNVKITPSDNKTTVTLKNSGVSTYLGWSRNNFAAIDSAQQIYLARVNTDIDRQGLPEKAVGETDLGDLSAWKNRITSSKIDAEKTAQVHDFDKRIYEIDITASSNMHVIQPSIDLELIVDTSRSMFFPATLDPVPNTLYNSLDGLINVAYNGNLNRNKIYYFIGGGEQATVYALYYAKSTSNLNDDTDAASWRYVDASYLNPPDAGTQNWDTWLNKMEGKNIADFGISSEILNFPEERNGSLYGRLYTSPDDISRFAYLKEAIRIASEIVYEIDENARIGLVTFNANASPKGFFGKNDNLIGEVGNITLAGGTQQDKGLSTGQAMFASNPRNNTQKIAVLITDGAPNKTTWSNIETAATNLKNSGVTLYTLGLSLEMVGGQNASNLAGLITTGDNVQRAYAAENGPEIATAVKGLIESLVRNADIEGTVSDTIDQAYYPVRKDGTPLEDGDYIDLQGNYLSQKPASGTDYGQISFDGTTYSVTWVNQRIRYKDENAAEKGWRGTFYVKAKEDFLGGNTIKTNSDTDADKILAEKLIVTDPTTHAEITTDLLTPTQDKRVSVEFDTPIVNVKELSLTKHDLTWTLYLGSDVTEEEIKNQIKNLFDNINVKEIVNNDGTPVTAVNNDPVTFLLETLIGGTLTDQELTDLLDGKPVTRDYNHYGHEKIGTITINLTTVVNEDGDTVYTLSASYASEDPITSDPTSGEAIDWHNGPNGPGRPMNPIISDNTQTIRDYYLPESFEIKKIDSNGNVIVTSPAMFKLYRAAKAGETGGVSLTTYDPGLTSQYGYLLIDTVHTSSVDGIAHIGGLLDEQGNEKDESLLMNAADGPYYLIETGAPIGYTRIKTPTVITVTAGPDLYTDLEGNTITVSEGETPSELYNLTQGVTITVAGEAASETIMVDPVTGRTTTITDGDGNARSYLTESDIGQAAWQTSIVNNNIPEDGGVSQGQILPHRKTIDYLGDLQDNPDTTADNNVQGDSEKNNVIHDLYRLYLDAEMMNSATNANIILVEDCSASMNENVMDGKTRYELMRNALIGNNGFVRTVLADGTDNRMTVIKFSGKQQSAVLVDWTDNAQSVLQAVDRDYVGDNSYVTNYEYALELVEAQLTAIEESRRDYPIYVIFVSDGLPTVYFNKSDDEVGGYESMTNPPAGLTAADVNGREVVENLNVVLANSIDALGDFKNTHRNIQIASIGLAENMNQAMVSGDGPGMIRKAVSGSNVMYQYEGFHYDFILQYLATKDPLDTSQKLYMQATSAATLKEALLHSVQTQNIKNVLIADELSDYVNLYTNQPDFAVTRESLDGTKTELTLTYDAAAKNYKVTDGATEVGRIIIDGKQISLDFVDDPEYRHGDKFTLSFNVTAATKAYEDYVGNKMITGNNGYGTVTGEAETDYAGGADPGYTNATSSEKPGFYSNRAASVEYTYQGTSYTLEYDKPVIQVGETKLEIEKQWEDKAPEGIDEITVYVLRDGVRLGSVILKRSDGWKTTYEHLLPKKLVYKTDDSNVVDKNGNILPEIEYVPYVYTLEEDFEPEDAESSAILKKYGATYEFTATETADKSSFTNMSSKYENGKLLYYIPASAGGQESESGKAIVRNKKMVVDIQILKVDERDAPLETAVFRLQKKEDTYQNIKSIKNGQQYKYPDVGGLDSNSSFTTGTKAVTVTDLPDGEYKLIEDSTKAGYIITQKEIEFTIADGEIEGTDVEGAVEFRKADDNIIALITITNQPGAALPNTGGSGTEWIYLIGTMFAVFSGAGLMMRKRKSNGA